MKAFAEFLAGIDNPDQRLRTEEVLRWVAEKFPQLKQVIKWNQPMFTNHDTYIIGFSVSQKHLAVAPEQAGINRFTEEIEQAGYSHTKEIIRIPWDSPVNFSLLEEMIAFNIEDKANYPKFWRSVKNETAKNKAET